MNKLSSGIMLLRYKYTGTPCNNPWLMFFPYLIFSFIDIKLINNFSIKFFPCNIFLKLKLKFIAL
jgi:hypothetical protein